MSAEQGLRCATWIGRTATRDDPRCPNEAVTRELTDADGTGRYVTIGHCQFHSDYWAKQHAEQNRKHHTYVQTIQTGGYFASCMICGCEKFSNRDTFEEARADAEDHGTFEPDSPAAMRWITKERSED